MTTSFTCCSLSFRVLTFASMLSLIPAVSLGCKSADSGEEKTAQAQLVETPAVEAPVVEEEPVEPPFCAEGAEEYSRKGYKWCVRDGVMDGPFVAFSESGVVTMEGTFVQGAMTGEWMAHDPVTGKRVWRASFVEGREEGAVEGYHGNGQVRYRLNHAGGTREGESAFFDSAGTRIASINFVKGQPAGEWIYWHKNGQKAHEYTYKPSKKPKKAKKSGPTTGKLQTSIHQHWTESGEKTTSPVGRLGSDEILPVLEPLEQAIVECYMHSRIMDDASGKIVAQIHIGYGGEVSHVGIFADDFQHPFMSACTRREIERLTFPDNPYGPQQLIRTWDLRVE